MQMAFPRYDSAKRQLREEKLRDDLAGERRGAFWGVRDAQGRLAASLLLVPFQLSLGGGLVPVLGVGAVAVHPAHRHKGLARLLLEDAAVLCVQEGAVMLVLYPFSTGFYRHLGFGPFTEWYRFRFLPRHLRAAPDGCVRMPGPEACGDAVRFYERWAREHPGMLLHPVWDRLRLSEGRTLAVHYAGDGTVDGYLCLEPRPLETPAFQESVCRVCEMAWSHPAARDGLMGFLAGLDAQYAWLEFCTPFREDALLAEDPDGGNDGTDPQGIRRYGTVSGGCMARIPDAARFYQMVPGPGGGEELTVALRLSGPHQPESGETLLCLTGREGIQPVSFRTPDVCIQGEAAAYTAFATGAASLKTLCRYGRLSVDETRYMETLQQRLGKEEKPGCFTYF